MVEECKYCKKECKSKNSLKQHEIRCKFNENRIEIKKRKTPYVNPWTTELRKKQSERMFEINKTKPKRFHTEEVKKNQSVRMFERNKTMWTPEFREKHSKKMQEVVKEKPQSYLCGNLNGRTKWIEYKDSYGTNIKLNGSWEVLVAEFLNKENINWSRPTLGFEYKWENKKHIYFPDFYLNDYDIYIEVKGFERERDKAKLQAFTKKIILLKNNEIQSIKNNTFKLNI